MMGGVPHDFLRHAAYVHAGSAERFVFDDRRPRAIFGCALSEGQPTAAAADYDYVKLSTHSIILCSSAHFRRGTL